MKSVLVVEDMAIFREPITACLRANGYEVASANNGAEALTTFKQKAADLILLDIGMPIMNGLAFLQALAAETPSKMPQVILLTAMAEKDYVIRAAKFGVRDYLLKSRFSLKELLNRVSDRIGPGKDSAGQVEPDQAAKAPEARSAPSPSAVSAAAPASAAPSAALSAAQPSPTVASPKPAAAVKIATADAGLVLAAPNLVPADQTLTGVLEIAQAKTLAGVISEVIAQTSSPKANFADLAAILKQDPVLSARVIQMAGSAAYGAGKPRVGSLEDAVRNVGVGAVRDLALSVGIFQTFPPHRADGLDLLRCWQHAFAVASIMGRIVPKSDTVAASVPYLIGLCHDLSDILLRQRFPNEYAAALDFARQASQSIVQLLPSVFGVSYADLVGRILETMKFPPPLPAMATEFAKRPQALPDAHATLVPRALSIANSFAHALQLSSSLDEVIAPVLNSDCSKVLMTPAAINCAEVRAESITMTCILAKVPADLESALMNPQLPKRELKVWYVRHTSFAALDPIEAALSQLCGLQTKDRLPRPDEAAQCAAIVLTSPPSDTAILSAPPAGLPTLHLVAPGSRAANSTAAGIERLTYPVTLRQLDRFVASLPEPPTKA